MRSLDFLGSPPQNFIFQKGSNKTIFGGVLTLIYLLALFVIAFIFIYDYSTNSKYLISYAHYQKAYNSEIREKAENDPKYNPTLEFIFDLYDMEGKSLSNNYILIDHKTRDIIERNEPIQYNISNLNIAVIYKCLNERCFVRPEDEKQYEKNIVYYLNVRRTYYEYDLQNKNKPVIKKEKVYTGSVFVFKFDLALIVDNFWQTINIIDEKGIIEKLFPIEKESIGGNFYKSECSALGNNIYNYPDFGGYYRLLLVLSGYTEFTDYIEYRRKRISVIDVIANIFSFSMAMYNGFKLFFSFLYSDNFDNYKIIDKILSSKNISFKKKKIDDINLDNSPPLLSELRDINEGNNENENDDINKIIETKGVKDGSLPKFHFFDFIYNTFYLRCCKKNKAQECILICKEINQKYNSIENIIYNQLMLENLFKDYKWNNPKLNSIENIELINKLEMILINKGQPAILI